ncbi:Alpha/Beta hydrolase protein [Dendryphion nanum]|uniref:Alpha/Beta hydrolase protein n=1 Tax=Dendryphion nanum TaxID=256645 RepID=A0A9P9EER6_9PLEO|nr:Alpha/Beta hydrolase protein [Dendryphion nanum]
MASITPFTIQVPEEKLQRLKQKLSLTDFPDELSDVEPWSQGPPLADIKRLTRYWETKFDWRAVETKLNQFPQFTTNIEVENFGTYNIHFIHQRSSVKTAIPLLFVHGWPGSFIEVTKILSDLVQGGEEFPAFHVVAPSLVDFGFSSASQKKGFGFDQHAEVCHKLMLALGYDEYVTQGGDLGSLTTRTMVLNYGLKYVKAHHLNGVAPAEPTVEAHSDLHTKMQQTPLDDGELAGLARCAWLEKEGNGYFRKQATKPQTAAYFMADSPVGLLSWIYEALHDWVEQYPWTDDEILTWISIYYFSKAGPGAANYIYYEMEHSEPPAFVAAQKYSEVPLGVSRFPYDLMLLPKLWNHTLGPVVYEKVHDQGGHFAAWEQPGAIVADLRAMFGKSGGAYNVVSGKNGYV